MTQKPALDSPVRPFTAVRTGAGKSQIARWLARRLRAAGLRPAMLRHPMPYSDLERQRVRRFASLADLDDTRCMIEEREEYEPHIAAGGIVFAGVDYAQRAIAGRLDQQAQKFAHPALTPVNVPRNPS